MHARYLPNFSELTTDEARFAWACGQHVGLPLGDQPPAPSGAQLFEACNGRIHHADIVVSMARRADAIAVTTVEKLIGHPIIRRLDPPPEAPRRGHLGRPRGLNTGSRQRQDARSVVFVAETNPKKAGSKAHARFALYKLGLNVTQLLAAGLTTADIKFDTDRGHVRME